MRRLTITVDSQRCVGNAQCLNLAPGVFRHNEQVQSEVYDPAVNLSKQAKRLIGDSIHGE